MGVVQRGSTAHRPGASLRGETWVRVRLTRLVSLFAVASLAGAATLAGTASAATPNGSVGQYVVRAHPGDLAALTDQLHTGAVGATTVVRSIGIIDALVVRTSAAGAAALAIDPLVAEVTPDAAVQLDGSSYDATSDPNSMSNIEDQLHVDDVWDAGDTGQGVDVALIDSGVTPVLGLAGNGKVVNGPDLSFESQSDSLRYLDTFGHGTFMAGLIAGDDPGADGNSADVTDYQGVAPGARIVSVKVADAFGRTDVSQVIAGIDWVVQHAHDNGLNIRVLNLSFGTDSVQPYTLDPLAYAAEVAWRSGIVVVVSSGNKGGTAMADPAIDPYLIAVGAIDTNGSKWSGDDTVASFTATGTSTRRLDVVTPGVHVQGLRVPGSFIDTRFGATAAVGTRFFRGSGTSEAAAITSGVVALMLSQRPNLTPDQVKKLLKGTATTLRKAGSSQGAGEPNANRATFAGWPGSATSQSFPASTGTGSLEASRGSVHVVRGGVPLAGEQDIFGNPVDTTALAASEAAGASWAGGVWNGATWAGASWDGASWDGATWAGASWDGASWSGASWDGASWDGASWDGASWDGASWDGASWDGASWDGADWAGESWQ
jgi:serine protease AprX